MNRAIVFTGPGCVEIATEPVPVPGPGQVLVRTRRSLISTGTELTILEAQYPKDSGWAAYGTFPFRPGYNCVGEVVDAGEDADRSLIGQTVACCAPHALYAAVDADGVFPVRRTIPDREAVFFTIALIVMNGVRRSGVTWGEAAAVYGLGLLGQFAARFCRLAGAGPVFAVDVAPQRLAFLRDDPGIVPVNGACDDAAGIVRERTRGRMADVVFELTGVPDLIPREFAVLHEQGRFVVLSSPKGPTTLDLHDLCNAPSHTIIGAHVGSHPDVATPGNPWTRARHAELFFDLLADRALDVASLITHERPFDEAPALYAALIRDRTQAMGVVLDWSSAGA